jgi:hypothetical protein
MEKIVARVARALGGSELIEGLARRLAPTDLQSLMLHVYRERSQRRTPAELLAQHERSAMVQPSTADPRLLIELEQLAFACAAGFAAVEPSPVAPLGLNVVLGQIDQNSCLATVRNAEVLADPTTVNALECARRRRAGEAGTIRLCARSRQLRLQPFDTPGFSPHFGMFSLVSAGRDRGGLAFELESLREHLSVHLSLLARLPALGYTVSELTVDVSDTARDQGRLGAVERELFGGLAAAHPEVAFRLDPTREQGRSYYAGLCLSVNATDASGHRMNLADGGFTDWTRRLLSNAKERLMVSGMGIEILPKRFRR